MNILLNVIKECNQLCCIQLDFSMNECFHSMDLHDYVIKSNCNRQSFVLFTIIDLHNSIFRYQIKEKN